MPFAAQSRLELSDHTTGQWHRFCWQSLAPCWVQDVIRRYKETHDDFEKFADKVSFQLNDTHPTIAVPELMRLLMDDNGLGWTKAWEIVNKVCMLLAQPLQCISLNHLCMGHGHCPSCTGGFQPLIVHCQYLDVNTWHRREGMLT